ncbi:hypothetical protein OB955_21720 [Halobacteria archaeon AArc-m2/3/4]|uniref:Uncharacterized protein n=1 Tax=Natronoglomus mannanivorans TaxID=2979990 RepID=A0AAP3E342_9EURY|nr:hypothetical protein [Halobacteria archaeon AArc-xg1-1]MCU4975325.1 hypothetical protein [Halobacteria archaeon AArc-m2/3/4]
MMMDNVAPNMLEQFHERINHPAIGWLVLAGVAMILIGFAADFLGVPDAAGFLGMYGVTMFLFAAVGYGSLLVLKLTSPLFMEDSAKSSKSGS